MSEQTTAPAYSELLYLGGAVWVLTEPTGNANYDFPFDAYRSTRTGQPAGDITAVGRFGAIPNYEAVYSSLRGEGVRLIHTPEQHLLASELPRWYPVIADLTAPSIVAVNRDEVFAAADRLGFPFFMKGSRQTIHHRRSLSVIESCAQLEQVLAVYDRDPILRRQTIVCRELVPLRVVEHAEGDQLPKAFEFRTFWWKGELAGYGRYWWQGRSYSMTVEDVAVGLPVAQNAADRIGVPFLVVDIAQTSDGRWLVIECNDGQESGYAGVCAASLWHRIIGREKG